MLANISGTADTSQTGKNFGMGNNVYLAGSGELDNGMTVSMSFELDSGVDTGTGTGPFDNHYVEVGSDALGTLRLSGHGGSSAQSAMDTTAAGDIWNQTLGITGPTALLLQEMTACTIHFQKWYGWFSNNCFNVSRKS